MSSGCAWLPVAAKGVSILKVETQKNLRNFWGYFQKVKNIYLSALSYFLNYLPGFTNSKVSPTHKLDATQVHLQKGISVETLNFSKSATGTSIIARKPAMI